MAQTNAIGIVEQTTLTDEVYDLSAPLVREFIAGLLGGLVGLGLVLAGPGWREFGGWVLMLVAGGLVSISVSQPQEVRISPSGEIRVVSVWRRSTFPSSGIKSITRQEGRSSGYLLKFTVKHSNGSTSLPGYEWLFASVKRRAPGASVSTEKYDDTGD